MPWEPLQHEHSIYELWEKSGHFEPLESSKKPSYCIVHPPPNVTGALHMGHALTATLQDTLIRWKRMSGFNTLWLPGADHAGIATQIQVEKALQKEGKTRHDLGRENFLKRTWKWKEDHESIIRGQLKRMGASFAWSKERFTLDAGMNEAVIEVFVSLYEQGLIYRGNRIIQWCPRCQTALSDLEVIPTDRTGKLWWIKYPVVGMSEVITIATTRPETMLGDAAVAIHPDDVRFKKFHGKKVCVPLVDREVPIILDSYVDPKFGSGALKVTPAHDFNDYDLGLKHGLKFIEVMGKDGTMAKDAGTYQGLRFAKAREQILKDLETKGLLHKEEKHVHKVGLCQRCDSVVEPIISQQWFVKMGPLAKPAIDAVENGKIEFIPDTWTKTYFEWMNNIRDWCISRQLWWGHRIPAYHCSKCQEIMVASTKPSHCKKCQAKDLHQDEDVLDTWFSSSLWPFATLGWPKKTKDFELFYPNTVMETGFDILFFWVARMIMMGLHFTQKPPFKKVFLHAMVRDEKGEKMSKSRGNVVDPLVVIDRHGTDALRFTFLIMAGQGRDIKLSLDRVSGYQAFCNKVWNAVQFYKMSKSTSTASVTQKSLEEDTIWNQWILGRLSEVSLLVNQYLDRFEFSKAAQLLYDFAWHELCDWYLELSKGALQKNETRAITIRTLEKVLSDLLKLLHPFVPFVTESLWGDFCGANKKELLLVQDYPKGCAWTQEQEKARVDVNNLKAIVEAVRTFRGENRLAPKLKLKCTYETDDRKCSAFIEQYKTELIQMAHFESFDKNNKSLGDPESLNPKIGWILVQGLSLKCRVDLEGLVDTEEEKKRIKREIEKIILDLNRITQKLSNESFVKNAPEKLVTELRVQQKEVESKQRVLENALLQLSKSDSPGHDKK